ncbi:MAG: hypothetical protein CSA07_00125 [Bacteroidia bacterium]|nr:MAG: hypothetical protein CSA07_00125 [Bacteroidia bacterium]
MSAKYQWKDTSPENRLKAAAVTLVVQLLLLLFLLLFGFVTPLPLPAEEGIAVSFGSEDAGLRSAPARSPRPRPTPPPPPPVERATPDVPEQNMTQDFEDAPAVAPQPSTPRPPKKPKERKKPRESKPTPPTPAPPREVPPTPPTPAPPERTVDQESLFPGEASSEPTVAQGSGSGGRRGNQGTPEGQGLGASSGQGGGSGTQGVGRGAGGGGVSFNLGGRGALLLPRPEYRSQRSGKVIVKVWVDRQGRVTRAEAGVAGSTTFDPALLRAAERAARESRFDVDGAAPANQIGTIAYIFRLQQ